MRAERRPAGAPLRLLVILAVGAGLALWGGRWAQATPKIQHWRTDHGARVYFVEARELPIVDVRVVFDAGAARDGDQQGLASLTNAVLMLGAGSLSADAIAERFESVGARPEHGTERDMAWLAVRSLSDRELLGQAMDTLALILTQPTFSEEHFERERQRRLVALEQQKQSPDRLAKRAFYRNLYGDHPYGNLPLGTVEAVNGITRQDVAEFHRRHYVARNAVLAIVGDLDRAQARSLAERLTGELPPGEPAPALPQVPALEQAQTVRIEHPSTQTHVLIGQPGLSRGDPDYFPLYLGNHALGGSGLVSRISEEVREKRGLSYSAYSYFAPMRRRGPFVMGMQTRNEQAQRGIRVLRQTLSAFIEAGIEAEELEAAKKNLTGGFALRIDSNNEIVQYIAMIGFYGLPLDYLERFIERVQSVRRQEVVEAFRRRLDPERMLTVIVGGDAVASGE